MNASNKIEDKIEVLKFSFSNSLYKIFIYVDYTTVDL